jgi:pyruvate,orthophosphate dikinase
MTTVHPSVVPLDGTARLTAEVVGNKGRGIDMMCRHGLPVPAAFCLTTDVGAQFLTGTDHTLDDVWDEVLANLHRLERQTGRRFGGGPQPLLLSVRGGATRSMPGMLATMLNIGLNPEARDALVTMFGTAVAGDIGDRFHRTYTTLCGDTIPHDPLAQLRGAIAAVFWSWNAPRPLAYRRHHRLDDRGGTAAVVQAMVFGNLTRGSGTGVLFSRNPVTGSAEPFGEWAPGCQGPDLVSGTTDVQPLSALAQQQPIIYRQLLDAAGQLEKLTGDAVDIEFTVESGKLWVLQSRKTVRPARVDSPQDNESNPTATVLATGAPACPGVASGRAYTDVDAALDAAEAGEDVILVRSTTSPDDVPGMLAARGVVTEIGGVTSHAAVLSREIGRPAVVGCGSGLIDALNGRLITVDGTAGEVRAGA